MTANKVNYGIRKDDSIWISFTGPKGYHQQFDWHGDEELLLMVREAIETYDTFPMVDFALKVVPAANEAEAIKIADKMVQPYGWCPTCGGPGVQRERRIDGDTICLNGHRTKSKEMLTK